MPGDDEVLPGLEAPAPHTRGRAGSARASEPTVVRSAQPSGSGGGGAASQPARPAGPDNRGGRAGRGHDHVETAGAVLERRVARLEFAEGALARLRVPVYVDAEAGRDVLTDLDVLAIDVDSRLRLTRSILECKSGKGQSGEGDRLLWLTGLRSLLDVDRAVLVRQTITRRGRALATRLGMQILDVPTLTVREAANAWVPERFAHVDGPACTTAESRTDTQLKGLSHIPSELVAFLRHKALLEPSHRILSALAALRRQVDSGGALPEPTRTILAAHALQSLVLAALADASRLDTTALPEIKRRIELALTVGSPDDDHVLEVLRSADTVFERVVESLHRRYISAGAGRQHLEVPSLRGLVAEPPEWIDRYLLFVQRLRMNPQIARDLLQTAELACFDALLGDAAYTNRAFDHLFTPEHRHLLVAAVRTLADVAGGHLSDALSGVDELRFDRASPALPDRRTPPTR